MKSVAAAEVAALAAWRVTTLGPDRRAGFSDDEILEFLPGARWPAVMRILNGIVTLSGRLKADPSTAPSPGALNEALQRATRLAGHDWLVCLVTDASGADPESRRLVTRLNDVIAVLIYDPLEANLPDIGRAVVARGEAQIEVDTGRRDLRMGFASEFDDPRARIERPDTRQPFATMRSTRMLADLTDSDLEKLGLPLAARLDRLGEPREVAQIGRRLGGKSHLRAVARRGCDRRSRPPVRARSTRRGAPPHR
jgi:hypothetical protein